MKPINPLRYFGIKPLKNISTDYTSKSKKRETLCPECREPLENDFTFINGYAVHNECAEKNKEGGNPIWRKSD